MATITLSDVNSTKVFQINFEINKEKLFTLRLLIGAFFSEVLSLKNVVKKTVEELNSRCLSYMPLIHNNNPISDVKLEMGDVSLFKGFIESNIKHLSGIVSSSKQQYTLDYHWFEFVKNNNFDVGLDLSGDFYLEVSISKEEYDLFGLADKLRFKFLKVFHNDDSGNKLITIRVPADDYRFIILLLDYLSNNSYIVALIVAHFMKTKQNLEFYKI